MPDAYQEASDAIDRMMIAGPKLIAERDSLLVINNELRRTATDFGKLLEETLKERDLAARLREVNAELLAALTGLMAWVNSGAVEIGPTMSVWEACRTAVAKAEASP